MRNLVDRSKVIKYYKAISGPKPNCRAGVAVHGAELSSLESMAIFILLVLAHGRAVYPTFPESGNKQIKKK